MIGITYSSEECPPIFQRQKKINNVKVKMFLKNWQFLRILVFVSWVAIFCKINCGVLKQSHMFWWANPGLYFVYFRSFKHKFYRKNCIGFSGIQPWMFGVKGEHADNLTITTAGQSHSFCLVNIEPWPFYKQNMGQSWPLFHLFLSFSHSNNKYRFIFNWKKRWWCSWGLNSGPRNGRCRRNHGAMAHVFIIFECKQCDQIWRNFATLGKFHKSLVNFRNSI